ncbi:MULTISPECIES: PE family protein [Mycobacterium ulcerans group]|uniref:PE family protein n=1 Tax=Mycobacterium ulcerans group TaxID=2993898 RepID=UPI00130E2B9B|nr:MULTISPECIES: PE family protein [Mycobacterium ulcerans group]
MSFVWVSPELVSAAAADVAGIGSAVGAANTAAAAATTELLAAGGDEVSAAIAELFGMYGRDYQRIAVGAAGFHARVAALLGAGADSYGWAESSGVLSLQGLQRDVWGMVNAPTQMLLGRPLIGDGADGGTVGGVGQSGGAGGLLWGNGGVGGVSTRAPALLISRLVSWVDDLWCRAIGAGV